jgi:16S rRNA (uracil1498-N3)-methyltransferase
MPAGRFVMVGVPLAEGAAVELPAEFAHQVRDVLRLASGDTIRLLDGAGGEYPAQIVEVARKRVVARLGARAELPEEPGPRVVLCAGMLKGAKFELVLQKCTELGVAGFLPLLTERSVAGAEELGEAKRRRWEHILAEAVEQSGGSRVPGLSAPTTLADALADLMPGGIALFPWEEARGLSLRRALIETCEERGGVARVNEVRIFIGPEGGFSANEAALAEGAGARLVTLGPRVLRAETAAIVASALTLDTLREERATADTTEHGG